MQRGRTIQRSRANQGHLVPTRSRKKISHSWRSQEDFSRALLELHTATNADAIFSVVRQVLCAEVRFSFPVFELGGLDTDRETFFRVSGHPGRSDADLEAMWAQLLGRPCYPFHFETTRGRRSQARPSRMELVHQLTPRERELAEVVGCGLNNADAAETLAKSVHTVKKQLRGVLRKLGMAKRARLAPLLSR